MPILPAICDNCKTVFPSGFDVGSGAVLVGNKSGPCPKCGGMGSVPNGVAQFIGVTLRMLPLPKNIEAEYRQFTEFLKLAQKNKIPEKEFQEKVDSEHSRFSSITKSLYHNKAEFYALLTVLIMVIQTFLSMNPETSDKIDAGKVLEEIFKRDQKIDSLTNELNKKKTLPKVGRNEKCPCGSGKKFKRCHGAGVN